MKFDKLETEQIVKEQMVAKANKNLLGDNITVGMMYQQDNKLYIWNGTEWQETGLPF